MVKKAGSTLSWVFSVFKNRDRKVMTTIIYKSLVRRLLEYCCLLRDPVKVTEIQLLEGVQRTFTNRIGSLEDMNYWERLSHLKLMSPQRRGNGIPFLILMMWKILHNIVPNCSNIRFTKTSTHMVP